MQVLGSKLLQGKSDVILQNYSKATQCTGSKRPTFISSLLEIYSGYQWLLSDLSSFSPKSIFVVQLLSEQWRLGLEK